jgi:hypothetical protein
MILSVKKIFIFIVFILITYNVMIYKQMVTKSTAHVVKDQLLNIGTAVSAMSAMSAMNDMGEVKVEAESLEENLSHKNDSFRYILYWNEAYGNKG